MDKYVFFYQETLGSPWPAKAIVDDGVRVGGTSSSVIKEFPITSEEWQMSLDALAEKYPL